MSFVPKYSTPLVDVISPGHGVAPVAVKASELSPEEREWGSVCAPPVTPDFDWPWNYFGTQTCCGKMRREDSMALPLFNFEILPQYSNRGFLTTVCEKWLKKHFPRFFILSTIQLTGELETCSVRLEHIAPVIDYNSLTPGPPRTCDQCSREPAIFNLFTRQKKALGPSGLNHFNTGNSTFVQAEELWQRGNYKWGQGYRWCLRCIYSHSELFNLFHESHLKLLKSIWPRARLTKRDKPDVSRHYAPNAYGPIEITEFEMKAHRLELKESTKFFRYIKRTYGADCPADLIGGLED